MTETISSISTMPAIQKILAFSLQAILDSMAIHLLIMETLIKSSMLQGNKASLFTLLEFPKKKSALSISTMKRNMDYLMGTPSPSGKSKE